MHVNYPNFNYRKNNFILLTQKIMTTHIMAKRLKNNFMFAVSYYTKYKFQQTLTIALTIVK